MVLFINDYYWGGAYSIVSALNFEKWGVKIHSCTLYWTFMGFFQCNAGIPLFYGINPVIKIIGDWKFRLWYLI